MSLTAGQRKLLCFMAFMGVRTTSDTLRLYARGENTQHEKVKKVLNSLTSYLKGYYYYSDEYELDKSHVVPLLLYMLREQKAWLADFKAFYKRQQSQTLRLLLPAIEACIDGEKPKINSAIMTSDFCQYLVPIATEEVFMPLLQRIPPHHFMAFVDEALVYQVENDIVDEKDVVKQLANALTTSVTGPNRADLRSVIALYAFLQKGIYDPGDAALDTKFAKMLRATKALYDGDYDTAFKQFAAAIRDHNRFVDSSEKGFFVQPLNNLMLVMTYYLKRDDEGRKLALMAKKDGFYRLAENDSIYRLANYLAHGAEPSKELLMQPLKHTAYHRPTPQSQYLALIVGRFFQMDIEWPKDLPATPHIFVLRQELERTPLSLLSRIRFKAKWELLLEELTPKTDGGKANTQQNTRVAYIVNSDWVEVREQTRLKSGEWGAGKRMSTTAFKQGTDFMDDSDRKIANSISTYYYDIEISKVLPHLIGSDRVYTGSYAPFTPVVIDEEKPYLIIERTKTAFSVKSNLGNAKLENSVVYRKDSDAHYTVITITDRQRTYYSKLLAIGAFPLDAEQQLREFLPRVSDVVEVHSDLVEGGSTLEQRQGTPQLCLQVLPTAGTRNLFNLYCMARPLSDGRSYFEPAQGLNPCVAEADGTRYQVTRDMRGERHNLQMLTTFLDDQDISDAGTAADSFANRQPLNLDAVALLRVMEFVREQPDAFYMEWPEGGQLHLKTSQPSKWNISLRSESGWFEVEGDIPIDDDTVLTAAQLLQLIAESPAKGFIRLSDTDFLAISDRLRRQLSRIESLAVSSRGHMQISEFHASLLGSALSGEIEVKHDKKIDQLQKKIKKSMAQQPAVPRQLKAELRDYQTDGFQWMVRMTGWDAGVCLADDMGLGKTVQTIAFLLENADRGPALVAAPASVVLNWQRELHRFAPTLNVIVLNTQADRQAALDEAKGGDVVLTTYGLFVTESDDLLKKKWDTVCLDEAHVVKNRETKTSAAVMRLQATHRIILTGTPVQNHLGELWNLFQFINPGLLGSYEQFQQKYIVPIEQQADKDRSKQLKRIIAPFILRRTKQEVIEELPDKTEINMPVQLTDDELAVYEVIRRRAKQLLEDETAANGVSVNTLAEIARLRQAACSAQLAEKGWTGECSKINTLMQLLEEIVGGGNSVLVFSQFTSFLAMVRKALEKAGQEFLYLDGAVSMKRRDQLVSDFQHGRCPVFLISLKAGGLGLNLTGANYVIHLDPWWNPAIEQQATDRAYRIGQRQNVTVYHLISQHTIEEKILRLHDTKRNLADAMLQGTSESHKLSAKDLLEMIGT